MEGIWKNEQAILAASPIGLRPLAPPPKSLLEKKLTQLIEQSLRATSRYNPQVLPSKQPPGKTQKSPPLDINQKIPYICHIENTSLIQFLPITD